MKKNLATLSLLAFTILNATAQKADFVPPKDVPRNIIVITVNGMGLSQLSLAAIEKAGGLNLAAFPANGFIKPWTEGGAAPTDSSAAAAIATNAAQNTSGYTSPAATAKNIFDWAKEKKMMTGIITTNSVTSFTPKTFCIDKPGGKDNEAIALEYLNSNINILIGGGSHYFDKRYDGRNLFNELKTRGYKIETTERAASNVRVPKTIGIFTQGAMYRASERKDFLSKTALNAISCMGNPDGYFLLIDDSKVEEGDTLNDSRLVAEELMDLDKLVGDLRQRVGGETLILVLGNYEIGGMCVNNGGLNIKNPPTVTWVSKGPSATLAPVFAFGPSASLFTGIYPAAEIYSRLESLMVKRR